MPTNPEPEPEPETETETIIVAHDDTDTTVRVPLMFERSDLAAFFGAVPERFDVRRVFILDGTVRAESQLESGDWVEACYQTEDTRPIDNANETGWVAEFIGTGGDSAMDPDYPDPANDGDYPGETVWLAGDDELFAE